jgi:hypothetical protein
MEEITETIQYWLASDPASFKIVQKIVDEATNTLAAAEAIKFYVYSLNPLRYQPSMFQEILDDVLHEVNWREIAEYFETIIE